MSDDTNGGFVVAGPGPSQPESLSRSGTAGTGKRGGKVRLPSNTPPTIPRPTCPIIDKAIRCLREASDPDCDMVPHLLATARDLLEEIREANGQLREAVEWWQHAAQSRQDRIDELESEAGK